MQEIITKHLVNCLIKSYVNTSSRLWARVRLTDARIVAGSDTDMDVLVIAADGTIAPGVGREEGVMRGPGVGFAGFMSASAEGVDNDASTGIVLAVRYV